jgi:hypothetical protein
MRSHAQNAITRRKRAKKKHVRKEVRDILKTIQETPEILEEDRFFYSHLGWESKTA